MKYRQRLVSSCAPASLQEWLAEELERRGIDGVYTRYILSLLLADTIDPAECAHVPHPRTDAQVHVSENKRGDKSRHRCRLKSWDRKKDQQGLLVHHCQHAGQCCDCSQPYLDSEQCKKLAAVECLKSASEQKSGIEKLIDEVCAKLKNFQADIETNPDSKLHAEIKGVAKQSPPQEQAELYYTTFPALSGQHNPSGTMGLQTLTQPQDQDAWPSKTSAWRKENHSCTEKSLVVNSDDEETQEVQNDLGKGNGLGPEKDIEFSEVLADRQSGKTDYVSSVELCSQPLFIVPKMKVPQTKVTNVTMYTPFTSAASYQSQKAQGENLFSREENSEEEEEAKENIEEREGDVLISDAKPWLTWKLHLPNIAVDENDLVTDLVSKFNSELAAIWETDKHIQETSLSADNLGFSFRILSVHSPVQKDVPVATPSVNFLVGSHLPSVWSAKTEDIKILNVHDCFELPEPLSCAPLVPGLLHNKVESAKEDPQMFWSSSEEETDVLLDDKSSLNCCKLDFSEQAWEDISQACEVDSEEHCKLFLCSKASFPDLEEHDGPLSTRSNSPSLLDSSAEVVTGIYSLWEASSPQPPFPVNEMLQAPLGDKVNWIIQQKDADGSWNDMSIWKENRTLTYHKGESRFKEVVPLTRAKAEEGEFPEDKMSLYLEECTNGLLDKPEEPEENLLTSPKTHFQPIRQDSSESESLSDPFDAAEPQQMLHLPQHCDQQSVSVVVTPPPVQIEEEDKGKEAKHTRSVSSSMDEMLFLTGEFGNVEESKVERFDNLGLFEDFQPKTRPELLLEDKSTSTGNSCLAVNSSNDETDILGFGPFHKDQIWSVGATEDQCSNLTLPWKWSTRDDSDDTWKTGSAEESVEEGFDNVKAVQLDCTLKAMKRELEEEEVELFRDINLLSDSEDFEAIFQSDFSLLSMNSNWARAEEEFVDPDSPTESQIFARQWELDSDYVGVPSYLEDSKAEEQEPVGLPLIPAEKALYSSELESEWHKTSLSITIQLPRKGKIKNKMHCQKQQQQQQQQQVQRKPCSFFLEGNCRRSDCKFSHNLGSITCRFWEEGSCFKGETCPFLHGYASDSEFGDITSAKCKFALESEADFPSLSTLSSSEPSSKQLPKEVVVGRIIRPKKKKMGPAAAPSAIKKTVSPLPPK